jgi:hypothetical protein
MHEVFPRKLAQYSMHIFQTIRMRAPLRGARSQYSVLALQLKKPRPAPPSIIHLYRPGPRARRLIAGPWECIGPVFTPRYYRGEIHPESCCTDFAVHCSIMSRTWSLRMYTMTYRLIGSANDHQNGKKACMIPFCLTGQENWDDCWGWSWWWRDRRGDQ